VPEAPPLYGHCICILDREAVALAAVISSILFRKGVYLPLFIFPAIAAPKSEGDDAQPESYLSNLTGQAAAIFINNAWARMHGSEYVILAGLEPAQKSYLSIPKGTKVIEIAEPVEAYQKLSIFSSANRQELRCNQSDLLRGLFLAERAGKTLTLDDTASPVSQPENVKGGIVVVENNCDVASVIAVNYANSVNANLLVVRPVGKREISGIHRSIHEWKAKNDQAQGQRVKDAISLRLNGTSFSEFQFATFFTEGLPYSLIIENVVPCSYVNIAIRPDLFVFNSIIFEHLHNFHSAIVFSPLFFTDEETQWLRDFFPRHRCYLRQLVGHQATFANLHFTAQHFPYGLLHISSHGGEVDGWEVTEEFLDRNGTKHVIEYDEVVGFDPKPDKDGRIAVHRKTIFRRLDGLQWMSEELDKQNVPQYVFHDMWKALYKDQRSKINPNAIRRKKGRIAMSCAIRCADTIHQGEFNILASHSSPLIFNNTCWSWYEVAKFFLSCGARGYIGTLWAVDNQSAVRAARTFYDNLFNGTVLLAIYAAIKAVTDQNSKDIYIYWGLHFTSLSAGHSAEQSRQEVFQELLLSLGGWKDQIKNSQSVEVRENATRVLKSVLHELNTNFGPDDLKTLEVSTKEVRGAFPDDNDASVASRPLNIRSSIDHPTEYQEWGYSTHSEE
jgi:hypothetical protein